MARWRPTIVTSQVEGRKEDGRRRRGSSDGWKLEIFSTTWIQRIESSNYFPASFHENPFPRISKLSGNSGGGNLISRNLDGVSRPSLARRRGKGGGGIIGEKLRASGGGGRLRGREGERRGMGRERRNIDRISVATDSIYPLLTGLLLGGFNFDSSRR